MPTQYDVPTQYDEIAANMFHSIQHFVRLGNYQKAVLAPASLSVLLAKIHQRLNENYKEYQLAVEQIDWLGMVFPQLIRYAKSASHDMLHNKMRLRMIRTLDEAHRDAMQFLTDMFVQDNMTQRLHRENHLRQQVEPQFAHLANLRLANQYPVWHAQPDTSRDAKFEAIDKIDQGMADYFLDDSHAYALDKSVNPHHVEYTPMVLPIVLHNKQY
jgi:hypothetical protein